MTKESERWLPSPQSMMPLPTNSASKTFLDPQIRTQSHAKCLILGTPYSPMCTNNILGLHVLLIIRSMVHAYTIPMFRGGFRWAI
jgi:hypothetical protein